jgi:multiple antibiotic resistance protein
MHLSALILTVTHFGSVVLLALGALLPIVNPLGAAPIFLSMTTGLSTEQRNRMAKAVAINSFLLLLASTLIGAYVLDFFGISIPAVQVAGGIVVCATSWQLLNSPNTAPGSERNDAATYTPEYVGRRAFYPLTLPLTVGPGSISVALTLGASPAPGFRSLLATAVAHSLGILIVAVTVFLCNRYAVQILQKMGAIGTSVVMRLSAFIMLCIGVQILWNGIHSLVTGSP